MYFIVHLHPILRVHFTKTLKKAKGWKHIFQRDGNFRVACGGANIDVKFSANFGKTDLEYQVLKRE